MKFDFDRSQAVLSAVLSKDVRGYLLFRTAGLGPILVSQLQLRIECHPEVGKNTGAILLDVVLGENNVEAVLTAESEEKLRAFFEERNIPYPGLSKSKPAATSA